jgi:intracellular septation protein A
MLSVVMLNVIMLIVTMLNVIKLIIMMIVILLGVIMQNVGYAEFIMLGVIMLNVVYAACWSVVHFITISTLGHKTFLNHQNLKDKLARSSLLTIFTTQFFLFAGKPGANPSVVPYSVH